MVKYEKLTQGPSESKHRAVSFVKSVVRIAAGVSLILGDLLVAGGLLIVAEVLGIVEELV